MFAVKLAGAGVAGSVLQRRGQLIDGQIARGHRGRVRLDANGGLSAIDGDLAHARENANALADLRIGVVEELALRRSEEHTSELQSRRDLVCRLPLEKKTDDDCQTGVTMHTKSKQHRNR